MEKTKSYLVECALLAIGLIVAGWMLRSGIVHFKDSERVVSVKGLSEKEVKANGVNLAETDVLLLQKIEELTLYIIELKQEIEDLKSQVNN